MPTQEKEIFRDSLGTITKEGKRAWVYPKKPKGKLYEYRKWVSYFFLTFLFLAPFIKINGNQFLMFNVIERHFNIFGLPFWPQDFYLFVILMIVGIVFVTLFTVVFGRFFCGWICPQTIFLEMVFRRFEYWIEGDRGAQIQLDKQEWNTDKIKKRFLKWSLFLIISFLIANIFLAYLIGSDKLMKYITDGPSEHINTLISLSIFTAIFYFIYTSFREQVCIIACPYGRLQGVLLDNKSIVVAYDHKRGEGENGRKKIKKNENREALGHGDCIDCFQCVNVCPTGIDIRNGTQLECVNCTACIDECNTIMEKVKLPKGLIRFASDDTIEKKAPFKFSARMKGYSAVLFILIGVLTAMILLRNDVEATVLRLPGQLFEHKGESTISNIYTFKIINKTIDDFENVTLKLESHKGMVRLVANNNFTIPGQGLSEGTLFIEIDKAFLDKDKTKLKIGVYSNNELIETAITTFLGPRSYR